MTKDEQEYWDKNHNEEKAVAYADENHDNAESVAYLADNGQSDAVAAAVKAPVGGDLSGAIETAVETSTAPVPVIQSPIAPVATPAPAVETVSDAPHGKAGV